jgi:hypothetical protein
LKFKKKIEILKFLNILNFNLFFIFIDFRILKFYEFLKELFPFSGTQWVVYRETIGLLPGKQLVVSRLG